MPYIPHAKARLRDEAELALLAYRASQRPVVKLPPSLAPICVPANPARFARPTKSTTHPPAWLVDVLHYRA